MKLFCGNNYKLLEVKILLALSDNGMEENGNIKTGSLQLGQSNNKVCSKSVIYLGPRKSCFQICKSALGHTVQYLLHLCTHICQIKCLNLP